MPAYFEAGVAVAAGVAGAAAVAAVLFTAFLFLFTCFFATGAEASAGAGAVCAANDKPAVASVRESPSTAEVIFFMVICPIPFV